LQASPYQNASGRTAAGVGSTQAVGFQKLVIFLQREPFLRLEIFCFSLGKEYCTQPLETRLRIIKSVFLSFLFQGKNKSSENFPTALFLPLDP